MQKTTSNGIPLRRRPPVEQDRIARWVRKKIVRGTWKPGDRLPPREKLLQLFEVSSLTVQRAMDQLMEDGFINAQGARGTFVAERPPHRYRIGLAFAPERHDPRWSNLWSALLAAADRVERSASFRFETYLGMDPHLDTEGSWRLKRDIDRRALAGVIVDHWSLPVLRPLGLPAKDMPTVCIMEQKGPAGIPYLSLDVDSFYDKALARFKKEGRRCVTTIALGNTEVWNHLPVIERLYRKNGLEYRPEWVQGVPNTPAFQWGEHAVRLLLNGAKRERPDGLIVADDNLVDSVSKGLVGLGIRVPEDLRVVALGNWPLLPVTSLDLDWIGFDMCDLLNRAVQAIHGLHAGQTVAQRSRLKPIVIGQPAPAGQGTHA